MHCTIRRAVLSAVLLAFLLLLHRPAHATCPCGGKLEIVFVIDCTSSMQHIIGTVKAQAEKIVHVLDANLTSVRVGFVPYRTEGRSDLQYMEEHSFNLTDKRSEILRKIGELRAYSGGVEACAAGLKKALNDMRWTKGARKVIVMIGDEGPDPESEGEMFQLAREAKRRGIIVHTITISESAWLYFKNLNPEKAKEMERLHGAEAMQSSFRHPVFVETSEITGGNAVGSRTVRDLVKWLLAFGLQGASDVTVTDETAEAVIEWKGPEEDGGEEPDEEDAALDLPLIARLQHDGGWQVPHDDRLMLKALAKQVDIGGARRMARVKLDDAELFHYGLLYISGTGDPKFSLEARNRLREYVEQGGVVLIDPGCESDVFLRAMRELLAEQFGPGALRKLPIDHDIFDVAYDLRQVRRCVEPRRDEYETARPQLLAVERNGRPAVIYSPLNLGCGWQTVAFGKPCHLHDEDALRMTINIIVYCLQ